MLHPIIYSTSQICYQLGVRHAVMSPGSRNAPLTISFARNSKIKKYIIPDERSAGFVALGIAQKTKDPVVLCCTSGTALLNYAPAIAEAYYREIPLIVLSADRPSELIDQRDGQTIRQFEALRNHVKNSFQLPIVDDDSSALKYQNVLIQGIKQSHLLPKAPTHFNIPFKEPFYPEKDHEYEFENFLLSKEELVDIKQIDLEIESKEKVLILVGQHNRDEHLSEYLASIQSMVPIIQSPLNNLQIDGIEHVDGFLDDQKHLRPDILITLGLSVLSKKLKNYIRNNKPKKHYHFDPSKVEVDTYTTNPEFIDSDFIETLSKIDFTLTDQNYLKEWKAYSEESKSAISNYLTEALYSELAISKRVLDSLPTHCHLHLGNSMPVRFADLLGVQNTISTWSNRGTSGIDGCTSTTVGSSLIDKNLNVLISGDVSFLYDRNAFFHNYKLPNLRIFIFNNQGGGIFRLIEGPANLPELEHYFETRHHRTAEYICLENEIEYHPIKSFEELEARLSNFYNDSDHAKVIEIFTDPEVNQTEYKKLKNYIHEHIH